MGKSSLYQINDNREIAPENSDVPAPIWKFWKRRRHVVAVLGFLGFFNVYSLRVNFSVAIVAMTENRTIFDPDGNVTYHKEFDWNSKLQGILLGGFFYGYIMTQLLGGWLGARVGGKKIFGLGIAATAILTLVTPMAAKTDVYFLLALRIIEGIFEGVTFPCIHAVWSRWAPPLERTRLATFAFSGTYVGTVVAMPLSAVFADAWGWESIFYIFGTIGILWFIVWWIIVAESPNDDPYISERERNFINNSMENTSTNHNIKHPWKSIVTSLPVWAIVFSHFSENWGFYTLLTQLPTFMKDVLNYELGKAGFMSALPYLVMAITIQFSGHFADWFRVKGILTTTQVRKVFNCGAFIAQTVFMISAGFWLSPVGTTLCLTLAVGLGAFAWSGFSVNHLDIAPQHASVLMGFSNTFATLPGIISPTLTGFIVTSSSSDEWRVVFYIAGGIYLVGCVFYGLFASGELQPWAVESQPINSRSSISKTGFENKTFTYDEASH